MPEFFSSEVFERRLGHIIISIVILFVTFIFARVAGILLNKFFRKSSALVHIDLTKYNFIKHLVVTLIYVLGIGLSIYTVPALRHLSLSIFAGAGIFAAVIGFASQQAFSNIVSGIFIVIFKPFRVDDRIQVGTEYTGVVEDITLRHTVIRNFENKRIVVPNSVISAQTVINFNLVDDKICRIMDIGISYDSDIKLARKIIQEEATAHPDFLDNRSEEERKKNEHPVAVRVVGFGDSAVNLRIWVWTKDPALAFKIGTDLYESVKERFDKEGIKIPFPHRALVLKQAPQEKEFDFLSKQ